VEKGVRFNIEFFNGYKKIKKRRISSVLGYLPQALVSSNFFLPRYYIYYKVRNRSFVKNLTLHTNLWLHLQSLVVEGRHLEVCLPRSGAIRNSDCMDAPVGHNVTHDF
jgi:hypothetical protein